MSDFEPDTGEQLRQLGRVLAALVLGLLAGLGIDFVAFELDGGHGDATATTFVMGFAVATSMVLVSIGGRRALGIGLLTTLLPFAYLLVGIHHWDPAGPRSATTEERQ